VDVAALAAHLARIDDVGYTIVHDAIETDLLDELTETLERLETDLQIAPGDNVFEGHHTVRIYNLLAHGQVFTRIPVHPEVLGVVEGVLDDGCLISSLSSIGIDPGETAQLIHADDQLIPLPKPHVPVVCNTMWALTDFTEANGATRLVPGSHRAADNPALDVAHDTIAAEMPRGSVLIWHGSLWHGGGANTSTTRRTGIAMNYCAGWIRQQENQQLGLDPTLVATFPKRLQDLVGYGIYHGLIGHIDKRKPRHLLTAREGDRSGDSKSPMLWDRTS
jgi:ectoine hydroxylase-related dioxygenase (phytanoyl-CoA dioxygenase family)